MKGHKTVEKPKCAAALISSETKASLNNLLDYTVCSKVKGQRSEVFELSFNHLTKEMSPFVICEDGLNFSTQNIKAQTFGQNKLLNTEKQDFIFI